MASNDSPKQSASKDAMRKQARRMAEIAQQISAPLHALRDELAALIGQIKTASEAADNQERQAKQHQKLVLRETKKSMWAFIVLTGGGVLVSFLTWQVLMDQRQTMDYQLRAMNDQVRAQRIDQRAWINVRAEIIKPLAENKPLRAVFTIENVGKTPAKKVQEEYFVQKVLSGIPPDFASPAPMKSFFGILPPHTPNPTTVDVYKDTTSRSYEKLLLTKKDIEELQSGKAYVATIARINYVDIYDKPHWVNFCGWEHYGPNPNGFAAAECVRFNDIIDRD